jgi:hypothetical protein
MVQSLPAEQKAENALDPKRSSRERRRNERREKFFQEAMVNVAPENFSPEESFDLLFGRWTEAKRAVKRAGRRQLIINSEGQFLPAPIQNGKNLSLLPRPVSVLSRLNRSSIFPPLVPIEIEIEAVSVTEILATLKVKYQKSPSHHLLDALATASGMPWEICAEILLANEPIPFSIEPDDLAAARLARAFWTQYGQGRARYSALVAAKGIPQFKGDWAFFDAVQFNILLPGIIIPRKLKREDYLTNWVSERNYFSLDVYAGSTAAPLFQHRFLNDFNPLSFGKPPMPSESHSKWEIVP